jgi:CheY-like chemotaxis protein
MGFPVHSNSDRRVLKLLHIDDSEIQRFMVKEAILFAKIPFRFYEADCPKSAMAFFQYDSHPQPEVVLLDYSMEPHTGAELLDWLRVERGLTSVPVIMFSGSTGPYHVAECYAKGANHFLSKPSSFANLKEILCALYESVLRKTPEPIIGLRQYIADPRVNQKQSVPV